MCSLGRAGSSPAPGTYQDLYFEFAHKQHGLGFVNLLRSSPAQN